jgi:flagellar biogenesis protein FliO
MGELVLRAGLSLALVLALIAALAFLVRSRITNATASGKNALAHVARLDLGGRREIRLLAVRDHLLVVGVAPGRIELLADYPGAAEGSLDAPEASSPAVGLKKLIKFP